MPTLHNDNPNTREKHYDLSLLFITVFLCVFGLVMIYSASYYTAELKGFGGDYYFKKQLRNDLIGLGVLLVAAVVPYRLYKIGVYPLYVISIILMIMTNYLGFGINVNGRTRWMKVTRSISFQPSEVVKLAVILGSAFYIAKYARKLDKMWRCLLLVAFAFIPGYFVGTQDLSSFIIIIAIPLILLAIVGRNKPFLIILGGFALLAVVAAVILKTMDFASLQKLGDWIVNHTPLKPYQMKRIYVWNDPYYDAQADGYQVLQGLYAVGSGGLFGKGLGNSTQKLGFVPEARNDMIFSILAEELGLFGVIALMLLYLFMLYRMLTIALQSEELFGSLIAMGVFLQIALQVILNICVVTNVLPNTGVSLPFISYGGTSSIFLLGEVGMVLSVSRGER
ncbi:MAG: cell division protein FtsW [Lachnospiraceae bacterium]|nr:cell division protein FtsW [Lachnospiraceae bacterium]